MHAHFSASNLDRTVSREIPARLNAMAEGTPVEPGARVLAHSNYKLGFGTFRPLTSPAGSVGTTRFTPYSPHDPYGPTSGRSSRASPRAASDQGVTIAEDGMNASLADLAAQPLLEYCMVKPVAAPIVKPRPVIAVLGKPCAWMRFEHSRTPRHPAEGVPISHESPRH